MGIRKFIHLSILLNLFLSYQAFAWSSKNFCLIYAEIQALDSSVLAEYVQKGFSSELASQDQLGFKLALGRTSYEDKLKLLAQEVNRSSTVFNQESLQALLSRYPPQMHQEVLDAFYDLTLYSTMDDISVVSETLRKNSTLIAAGDPISGKFGAFNYLSTKSTEYTSRLLMSDKKMTLKSLLEVPDKTTIIVDEVVLDILRNNPSAVEFVNKAKLKLTYLDGFKESIDYSFATNIDLIANKIDERIASKVKTGQYQSTRDIRLELEKLGVGDRFQPLYYDKGTRRQASFEATKKPQKRDLNYESLVQRLSTKHMTKEELEYYLEKVPAQYREQVVDVALSSSSYKSMQNMTQDSVALKQKIDQAVQAMGKNLDDVVYIHPDYFHKVKSMSLVGHIFQNANSLSDASFVSIHAVKENPEILKGKVVVILDDYIGSGNSVRQFGGDVLELTPKDTPVIAATLYGTQQGLDTLDGISQMWKRVESRDFKTVVLHKAPSFENSMMARSELEIFGKGFANTNTLFSMEYMSPDNNNQMMLPFSRSFTYQAGAVKTWGTMLKSD
jgi:hypothetical protein